MVDKNLFAHDLAIAAILKNEGHYIKEWLDYHLLAGVDHFYLYDNDSTDNYAEIIAPYVDARLVTSKHIGGKSAQFAAYDDAVLNHRFACRYMAFVDLDEFILPRTTTDTITATLDDVLKNFPDASGLAVNWQMFGSNGHEAADLSQGVLERFTRRAPVDWSTNRHVKTVSNPRKINSVNENGKPVQGYNNNPVTAEKIALNHDYTKSREEFTLKQNRGRSDVVGKYGNDWFVVYDRNDEFDDGILRYRAARAKTYQPPDKSRVAERLLNALMVNLSPNTPPDFYRGKLETFLTCRATASYLQTRLTDSAPAKFFEEASLKAIPRATVELAVPRRERYP